VRTLTVAEEEDGYRGWRKVAGVSAGSIVASLPAAGYSAKKMKELKLEIEYADLLDYTACRISRFIFSVTLNEAAKQ